MTEDPRPDYIPFGKPEPEAPPLWNLEAEQAFLGTLLFDNAVYHEVADSIRAEDFKEPFHQRLYDACATRIRAGRLAEPTVLMEAFSDDPAYQAFGGLGYLADLMDHAPPTANAKDYVRVIADLALRREMVRVAGEMIARAGDRSEAAIDLVMAAEREVAEVSASGSAETIFHDIGAVFDRQFKRSREIDGAPPGVSSGIPDLDQKLGGFRKKNNIILGGRPGMMKSGVAVQWAINVAMPTPEKPKGGGVAFFSLEMPEEQLATRFGCALAYDRSIERSQNPTYEDFEAGKLNDIQWQRLEEAGRKLAAMPIKIDFRSKMKVSHMAAAARRLQRKLAAEGIDLELVIVDHVLKVEPEKRLGDKVQEIGLISDDLLAMGKDLDVPMVLLCQLGRDVDKREDKRPVLSDLKWSGSLEEDAAVVVFVYRPEYYNRKPEHEAKEALHAEYEKVKARYTNRLLFLIEKNRNGRPNQSVEVFCDVGCNAVQNLGDPELINRTIDFSKARMPEPEEETAPYDFESLDIPD